MKILVLCLPAIGDGLMATPTIRVLRRNFPRAEIDVACMMKGVQYVFKNNPYINNVFFLSIFKNNSLKGLFQLLNLRRKKYDISILTFPSYRREYHWVQAVIGAKRRIAHVFSTGYWIEFNFLNTDFVSVDEASHNVINNLNLVYALDIDWRSYTTERKTRYVLKLDSEDVEFGQKYINNLEWKKKHVVAIHPGSTNSPAAILRRWPTERYAEVAKHLIKKGFKIIIFAGPEEQATGEKLKLLISSRCCHVVNDVTFNQSLGILKQVRLLICNDNGFGHLANALGVRIVTLWASTNDKLSLPYNKRLVILVRAPKFIPWYSYVLKRSIPKGASGGMDTIKVDDVINAVHKSLANIHPS